MKIFSFLLIGFLLLLLVACGPETPRSHETREWMGTQGKLKILATTAMIADLVQNIVQENGATLTLIKGELDPHSYQLVKGDEEKFLAADLIFANGLSLEHGASLRHHLENRSKTVLLGDLLLEKDPQKMIYVSGKIDPHIWMDISLFAETIPFIVEALSRLDPEHANEFAKNGQKLVQKMLEGHQKIRSLLLQIPEKKRYLVTSHDAFNYFTRAYLAEENEMKDGWQKRFAAPEGLAPDSQLNPLDIQAILDHLKNYRISVLFPESNVSRDSIRKIVAAGKENGINLVISSDYLYGDAMGSPGSDGDNYLKMINHNAVTISRYLKEDI